MNNIPFFKKLKFFLFYRKTLKNIKTELERQFNIRIDEAYRMYTVINVNSDPSIFENFGIEEIRRTNQNYDLMPSYVEDKFIDELYQKTMKEFSNYISEYLNANGLSELYNFYQIDKINKFSYLVVLGFSLFKTDIFYKRIYQILQISIAMLIGLPLLILIMKALLEWAGN